MSRDFVEMLAALSAAGAKLALFDLSFDDLSRPDTVFDDAWARRLEISVGDLAVPVIGRSDFIANKKASGRPKDLLDIELLPPERSQGRYRRPTRFSRSR